MRVLLCVLFFFAVGCSHSAAYRQSGEAEDYRLALAHEIKPGMTVQEVQSRLGAGETPKAEWRVAIISVIQKSTEQDAYYPLGVEDSDRFLQYQYNTNLFDFLQFRDDRLINFDPTIYEDPEIFTFHAVM